ncbi:MAG TPA: hydroxymethylbilane synthase [Actinomycetota bacterium]|nr:hydroxymethylbilane synthase [Actinomycetota bacterium]
MRIGTRGSQLARVQTGWVLDRLAAAHPDAAWDLQTIATTGDRNHEAPLGTGVFVKEIQQALLDGRIDLAVHSLKDLPTDPTPGLVVAAVPTRADPRDALVGSTLGALAAGSRVGTGSPRREAQLRRLRPDLDVVAIRGNVPTRVEKARRGEVHAVLLAAAGLARLGIEPDEVLAATDILPAPGQGALALECRDDDAALHALLRALDEPATRSAVTAERTVLRALGGGCLLPVATYGQIADGVLVVEAAVTSADGRLQARARAAGDPGRPDAVGGEVARQLIDLGALDLLEGLRP